MPRNSRRVEWGRWQYGWPEYSAQRFPSSPDYSVSAAAANGAAGGGLRAIEANPGGGGGEDCVAQARVAPHGGRPVDADDLGRVSSDGPAAGNVRRLAEARQRIVLLHELVHVQRCDFLANLIAQFACAFHWFNPLVWLAARRIGCEREQACDDVVLRKGTKPAGYAEEVLRIAAQPSLRGLEAFGALMMARPSSLEGRLLAILDGTRDRDFAHRPRDHDRCAPDGVGNHSRVDAASRTRERQHLAGRGSRSGFLREGGGTGDLTPGLVAWWRGDGNGKDSAGKHDGTFPFGEAYAPGLVGGAFDFRRSYAIADQLARVSIPDSPDFQFSEEPHPWKPGFILRPMAALSCSVATTGAAMTPGAGGPATHGQISYGFNAADNQATAIHAPIQLHQWQHVAVTFDHGLM